MNMLPNQSSLTPPADQWGEMRSLLIRNLQAIGARPAAPECADVIDRYRPVSEKMDAALLSLKGLTRALSRLAYDGGLINDLGGEAGAIFTLIDVLEEKVLVAEGIQARL